MCLLTFFYKKKNEFYPILFMQHIMDYCTFNLKKIWYYELGYLHKHYCIKYIQFSNLIIESFFSKMNRKSCFQTFIFFIFAILFDNLIDLSSGYDINNSL